MEAELIRLGKQEDEFQECSELVVVKDSSVFRMGEKFDSYDELLKRLASHSKQSLVHYWRRDSRTVQGAFMKTARPIEAKLVYYSVKYACVYGGQKFFPRGKGQRHSMTMRTNCPSHIMVRASKSGRQLEVISVCNSHNHPVSRELYRKLPQDRRLSPTIKQEVLDLLRLGVDRKCVREYVRAATGKVLTNKDLLNLGAGDRRPRSNLKPARALTLLNAITQYTTTDEGPDKQDLMGLTESTDSQESSPDMDLDSPDAKGQCWGPGDQDVLAHDSDGVDDNLDCTLHETMNDPIGREVEIFYEEEPRTDKNIIEYLYPNIVDSYPVKGESPLNSSAIIIENIGLVNPDQIEIKNDSKDISSAMEVLDTQSFDDEEGCLADVTTNTKVKFKLVNINIDSIFSKNDSGKIVIQEPDGNENILFHESREEIVDSGIDLRNILVVRDPIVNGDVCNIPIQMLKLSANGTVELKSSNEFGEYISLNDGQGVLTFADGDQNIIVHNSSSSDITLNQLDNKSFPTLDFTSKALGGRCVCGKTNLDISKQLQKLRKEKSALEREVKALKMKKTKLRSEVRAEKEYSRRLARAAAERNANIKKALENYNDCDEIIDKIQYVVVP